MNYLERGFLESAAKIFEEENDSDKEIIVRYFFIIVFVVVIVVVVFLFFVDTNVIRIIGYVLESCSYNYTYVN